MDRCAFYSALARVLVLNKVAPEFKSFHTADALIISHSSVAYVFLRSRREVNAEPQRSI